MPFAEVLSKTYYDKSFQIVIELARLSTVFRNRASAYSWIGQRHSAPSSDTGQSYVFCSNLAQTRGLSPISHGYSHRQPLILFLMSTHPGDRTHQAIGCTLVCDISVYYDCGTEQPQSNDCCYFAQRCRDVC